MTDRDCDSKDFRRRLESFQKRAGYQFSDPELLKLAFIHGSTQNDQGPQNDNDRLEFLGDAALGLLVGAELYKEYPEADEGFMTIERSKLVCGKNLTLWGYEAGFEDMLCVGDDLEISDAMVEDAVEAVAGAFYLDGGLEAVKAFLQSFGDYPDRGGGFDARNHLARVCEREKRGVPRYDTQRLSKGSGALFQSTVRLEGQAVGEGCGGDPSEAERAAARDSMIRLCHQVMGNQGKLPSLLRAHYRKVLAAAPDGTVKTALKKDDSQSDLDLLFKIIGQTGPDHKPVFTAAAFRGDEKVAEGQGLTKKGACKAAGRAALKRKKLESLDGALGLEGLDLLKLKDDPDVKNRFQTLCERLGLGCPRYEELPLPGGAKGPPFRMALRLDTELAAEGTAASKKVAGNAAAWKALWLISLDAAGALGHGETEADALMGRLESQFKTLLAARGIKDLRFESASAAEGDCVLVKTRILNGTQVLGEAQSTSEAQARQCALLKTVTQMRLWDKMLWLLGLGELIPPKTENCRPDLCLSGVLKARKLPLHEIAAIRTGGSGALYVYRVGLFIGEELAACAAAPNKKMLEQRLALTVMDRLAHGKALVPEWLKLKPSPAIKPVLPLRPSFGTPALQPAAAKAPLAAKEKGPGMLHRFKEWFHRMGDLYTR